VNRSGVSTANKCGVCGKRSTDLTDEIGPSGGPLEVCGGCRTARSNRVTRQPVAAAKIISPIHHGYTNYWVYPDGYPNTEGPYTSVMRTAIFAAEPPLTIAEQAMIERDASRADQALRVVRDKIAKTRKLDECLQSAHLYNAPEVGDVGDAVDALRSAKLRLRDACGWVGLPMPNEPTQLVAADAREAGLTDYLEQSGPADAVGGLTADEGRTP